MSDIAIDIKDQLVTDGIGTFAATTGWGIYISNEPEGNPDTAITLYPTSVAEPNPQWLLEELGLQIRVRGTPGGYVVAQAKAQAIKDDLLGHPQVTINTTKYIGMWMTTDIIFLTTDDRGRPIFVTNWRMVREPASGTNRTSL